MRNILFLLTGAVLFFSCRSSAPVRYTPDQINPQENALLWKISANGAKKQSYLYGTIHLIPKDELRFSPELHRAFNSSQKVAFEIDMKEMTSFRTQLSLMTKAFMHGGATLKDLLSAEDYGFVKEKMQERGLPSGMFERLKPMFLSMMMASEDEGAALGGAGMTSVEMELYQMAKKQKVKTAGLETADYQMAVFDSIPYRDQAEMLVEALRNEDAGSNEFEDMMTLYRKKDINSMQNMVVEEGAKAAAYEDLLLTRRNLNWIPIMADMMRRQPTFFAVGAGHLGGPNGVIALLRKAGYKVEPLDAMASGTPP